MDRYSEMSDDMLRFVMKSARMDMENAVRSKSPIKMMLYNMAEETHTKAFEEYYRRYRKREG